MSSDTNTINTVAFFGYSLSKEGEEEYIAAYETAKLVAQSGRKVVNGGGPGIMFAATKGAKDGGGEVTVVYYDPEHSTSFEGKSGKKIADHEFEEENYIDRTKKLLELADAYFIFNGGTGTMSEFTMAWAVAKLYFGHHKPLILYGAFWEKVIMAFKENTKVRRDSFGVFRIVKTPQEALKALENFESILQKHTRFHHKICEGDECKLFV